MPPLHGLDPRRPDPVLRSPDAQHSGSAAVHGLDPRRRARAGPAPLATPRRGARYAVAANASPTIVKRPEWTACRRRDEVYAASTALPHRFGVRMLDYVDLDLDHVDLNYVDLNYRVRARRPGGR